MASSIISETPFSRQALDFGRASLEKWFTKIICSNPMSGRCVSTHFFVRSTFHASRSDRAVIIERSLWSSLSRLIHSCALGTRGTRWGSIVDIPYHSHIFDASSSVIWGSISERLYRVIYSIVGMSRSLPSRCAYSRSPGTVLASVSSRSSPICLCCANMPDGSIE